LLPTAPSDCVLGGERRPAGRSPWQVAGLLFSCHGGPEPQLEKRSVCVFIVARIYRRAGSAVSVSFFPDSLESNLLSTGRFSLSGGGLAGLPPPAAPASCAPGDAEKPSSHRGARWGWGLPPQPPSACRQGLLCGHRPASRSLEDLRTGCKTEVLSWGSALSRVRICIVAWLYALLLKMVFWVLCFCLYPQPEILPPTAVPKEAVF